MHQRRNRGERRGPHVSWHDDGYTVKDFKICGVFANLSDANMDAKDVKAMELEEDSDEEEEENEEEEEEEEEEEKEEVPFKFFREHDDMPEGDYNYGDLFIEVEKFRLK